MDTGGAFCRTTTAERHHATTANAIVFVGFVSQREPIIDLLYLGCKQRIEWDRVDSIRQRVCDAIVDSLIPCDTNRSSLNLVASQLLLCIWILFHLVYRCSLHQTVFDSHCMHCKLAKH